MTVPPDALALFAAVILLLPMGCFFLATPTFLLVKIEVPEVTQLLRAIISGYYIAIGIAGTVAMVLLVASGRAVIALGAITVAVVAVAFRKWLLRHMDAALQARDAGVANAARRLRLVHVQGMLFNAILLATVVASVPIIV
jgi:hypothetical protein